MATLRASRVRAPRAPAIMYTVLAASIAVLLGLLALSARQTPPPAIAELAPQSVEQIREALEEQTSAFGGESGGQGEGRGRAGSLLAEEEEEQESIDVPRVRRCVGDPPRQTEDPKSPPCVPYFDGDNGGATWKGVTANEIVVAWPELVFFEDVQVMNALVNHFNSRYEFYGRKIKLVSFPPRDGFYATPNPGNMQADAIHVDEEIGAFASLSYAARFGAEHHYYDELARRQIVSIAHRASAIGTEARYRRFDPYEWNTQPSIDVMLRLYGEFACKTLNNRPPAYAGFPQNAPAERVFGLIYNEGTDGTTPPIEIFKEVIEACGIDLAAEFKLRETLDSAQRAQNSAAAIGQMSQAQPQVTSIICWCDVSNVRDGLMPAASSQGYQPEWLISTYIDNDVDNSFRNTTPDQANNVIGISYRDKWLPNEDTSWWAAMREGNPGYTPGDSQGYSMNARYQSLLTLSSGIQLAGPRLTPETFRDGLHGANFPNPGADGPPNYQARMGFPGGRHTLTSSATMIWYGRSEPATVERGERGAICYVAKGDRHDLGDWPSGEPHFYEQPCR
ncbi:MAG: hypothetical protein ACRDI1_06455 [Actinomycetota bacterium]